MVSKVCANHIEFIDNFQPVVYYTDYIWFEIHGKNKRESRFLVNMATGFD